MKGKIIRGVGGFYYVECHSIGVVECKAKGLFRKLKIKPLVGDDVVVEILDGEKRLGNITEICERKNELLRPAVANVDRAVVMFAVSYPKPNLNLLDRFLLMMGVQNVKTAICFNKIDELEKVQIASLVKEYEHCGSQIFLTSTVTGEGVTTFADFLRGKTTVLAGPSGVGKSSLLNRMFPEAQMEVGRISEKIKRGKHTTRHSELFYLGEETYVMDTPGFTSLELPELEKEDLRDYYAEFLPYTDCRFLGCVHVSEPDCEVKNAVQAGEISEERYKNYTLFFEELRNRKKY